MQLLAVDRSIVFWSFRSIAFITLRSTANWTNTFIYSAISIMTDWSGGTGVVTRWSCFGCSFCRCFALVIMRWMVCWMRMGSFAHFSTVVTKHSVRFSCTCLTIHENSAGNAFQRAHYNVLTSSSIDIGVSYDIIVTFIYKKNPSVRYYIFLQIWNWLFTTIIEQ